MTKSVNVRPYFDDFDKTKGFHKILFVPGNPVQARELTQIQTILQEQVKRHGDHIFKNGTVVIPGHIFYDSDVKFIRLDSSYNSVNAETFSSFLIGKTITGSSSGVSAIILHVESSTASDPTTIFVKYVSSNGDVSEFTNSEVLTESTESLEFKIQSVSDYTGAASICTINEGVYYINGYFVGVNKQTVVVSKYSNTADAVVGLLFNESFVTAVDDSSLYDNSNGFTNYAAPGADRLKIELVLTVKPIGYAIDASDTDLNFIELLKVKSGIIQYLVQDTEYAQINKMLARRTYDESGDYVVSDFKALPKNYRSNDRGQWTEKTPYLAGDIVSNGGLYYYTSTDGYSGLTAPTGTGSNDDILTWINVSVPMFNNGRYSVATGETIVQQQENDNKYIVDVSPGKAYIRGFEVTLKEKQEVVGQKARDVRQVSDVDLYAPTGQYVIVDNLVGIPDITLIPAVDIKDRTGTIRGSAYIKSIELHSGTPGSLAEKYKIFLFGITMNSGYSFLAHARTLSHATYSFSASIVLDDFAVSGLVSQTTTTITGKGTLFKTTLAEGQQVKINGVTTNIVSITDNVTATVSTSGSATDVGMVKSVASIVSLGDAIKPMGVRQIKSIRDSFGQVDTSYFVNRYFDVNISGNTGTAVLRASGETFASTSNSDYIFVKTDGTIINPTSYVLTGGDGKTLTVNATTANGAYRLIASVKKQGPAATEKSKILTTKTIIVRAATIYNSTDTTLIPSAASGFASDIITLTECDATRIIKVTMSGDPDPMVTTYTSANEVDITSWYTLDAGQRSDYYEVSSIVRKAMYAAPTKPIKVTFEYYDHTAGDFFSVDSYKNIPYSMIPSINIANTIYNLRDCLDFRSRKADDASGFSAAGSLVSEPLVTTKTISTSFSHYLSKVDLLSLSSDGVLSLTPGISSLTPSEPTLTNSSAIALSTIAHSPFTQTPELCSVRNFAHKRYTMAELGRMDSRLKNVEYTVALNDMEKRTVSMDIKDANGLSRYKNGFLTDNFNSYAASDVFNRDYSASIRLDQNVLGPKFVTSNVVVSEPESTLASTRLAKNYQVTGPTMSLPYTEEALITQDAASHSEYINPYAVISYTQSPTGNMYPSEDIWVDSRTEDGKSLSLTSFYGYYSQDQFCRTKSSLIYVKGMKPNTKFNCFIDNIAKNASLTPCHTLRYTTTSSGEFIGVDTSGKSSDNLSARTTTIGSYDTLEYGEVLTFSGGGTAILVAKETQVVAGVSETVLKIANVLGTCTGTFTGSISGLTGTVSSITEETELKTNSVGSFAGVVLFGSNIPNGLKYVQLADSLTSPVTSVTVCFVAKKTVNILQPPPPPAPEPVYYAPYESTTYVGSYYEPQVTTAKVTPKAVAPVAQQYFAYIPGTTYGAGSIDSYGSWTSFSSTENITSPGWVGDQYVVPWDQGMAYGESLTNAQTQVEYAYNNIMHLPTVLDALAYLNWS